MSSQRHFVYLLPRADPDELDGGHQVKQEQLPPCTCSCSISNDNGQSSNSYAPLELKIRIPPGHAGGSSSGSASASASTSSRQTRKSSSSTRRRDGGSDGTNPRSNGSTYTPHSSASTSRSTISNVDDIDDNSAAVHGTARSSSMNTTTSSSRRTSSASTSTSTPSHPSTSHARNSTFSPLPQLPTSPASQARASKHQFTSWNLIAPQVKTLSAVSNTYLLCEAFPGSLIPSSSKSYTSSSLSPPDKGYNPSSVASASSSPSSVCTSRQEQSIHHRHPQKMHHPPVSTLSKSADIKTRDELRDPSSTPTQSNIALPSPFPSDTTTNPFTVSSTMLPSSTSSSLSTILENPSIDEADSEQQNNDIHHLNDSMTMNMKNHISADSERIEDKRAERPPFQSASSNSSCITSTSNNGSSSSSNNSSKSGSNNSSEKSNNNSSNYSDESRLGFTPVGQCRHSGERSGSKMQGRPDDEKEQNDAPLTPPTPIQRIPSSDTVSSLCTSVCRAIAVSGNVHGRAVGGTVGGSSSNATNTGSTRSRRKTPSAYRKEMESVLFAQTATARAPIRKSSRNESGNTNGSGQNGIGSYAPPPCYYSSSLTSSILSMTSPSEDFWYTGSESGGGGTESVSSSATTSPASSFNSSTLASILSSSSASSPNALPFQTTTNTSILDIPFLEDAPTLIDKRKMKYGNRDDPFYMGRENANVIHVNDLGWYLEKVLWKLGMHRKGRKEFMSYWLPRFSNDDYVALRFLTQDAIAAFAPMDISVVTPPPPPPPSSSSPPSPPSTAKLPPSHPSLSDHPKDASPKHVPPIDRRESNQSFNSESDVEYSGDGSTSRSLSTRSTSNISTSPSCSSASNTPPTDVHSEDDADSSKVPLLNERKEVANDEAKQDTQLPEEEAYVFHHIHVLFQRLHAEEIHFFQYRVKYRSGSSTEGVIDWSIIEGIKPTEESKREDRVRLLHVSATDLGQRGLYYH